MADDNVTMVRKMFQNFNDRRLEWNAELISPDCRWTDQATGKVYRGPQGEREFNQGWLTAFHDAHVEVRTLVGSGDTVCCEFVGRGTHTGILNGPQGPVQPTGRTLELPLVDVTTWRNGRIVEGRTYYDTATLTRQLGLKG